MGPRQQRHNGGEDEAISALGTSAEFSVTDHGAFSTGWTARRGVGLLQILAALTGLRGVSGDTAVSVSAHTPVETPRALCIQAIQAAIVNRTHDLFEAIYLPDGHQVCFCEVCVLQIYLNINNCD